MKKLFASLLAALMLCTGLSQFAFAAEPTDPNNQSPTEQAGEEQDKKPSPPPKNDSEEGKHAPYDYVNGPEGDCN
mgnify:FL=1